MTLVSHWGSCARAKGGRGRQRSREQRNRLGEHGSRRNEKGEKGGVRSYKEHAVSKAVGGVIVKVGHLADGVEEVKRIDHLLLGDVVRSRHLLELTQRLRPPKRV
jgi:hypothetical protein